ncbi:MAG TPA: hypothetical protein VKU88_04370 [Acidimicrobiales bacterium]|nr:hypothetical protein [Acidimicrobiales bacterium]
MIKPVRPEQDRVEIADIRAKLEEIRGDTVEVAERARPVAMMAGAAAVVVLVGAAFLLGRRRGRRKSTWVEVRRR